MWFKKLTGFPEESPDVVRENLIIEEDYFISKANGRKFKFGNLEISTLKKLQKQSLPLTHYMSKIKVQEIVADVQKLHLDPANENALFQAASQFNLLEMIGPHISPEQGIDGYAQDFTQGPACAIACGAGTIYRNYFVPINEQIGQTRNNQINCLERIAKILNNEELNLWEMQNGYVMVNQNGLLAINKIIAAMTPTEREKIKAELKVGIQWNTEVTISESKQLVSQIYCSALPVAYCNIEQFYWEYFAKIILEAAYEATFHAALINLEKNKSNKVYLTLLGGGAFGNNLHWILDSLKQNLIKFRNTPLEVYIVSYGNSNRNVLKLVSDFN